MNDKKIFLAAWMKRTLDGLAHAEIAVPRRYAIYTLPDMQFPRECIARAFYYVKTHRINRAGRNHLCPCGSVHLVMVLTTLFARKRSELTYLWEER